MNDSFYAGGGIGLGPRPPVPPAEPYPAPVISSRDGVEGPAKTAVQDLMRLAEAHGWAIRLTYAKGHFPNGATGRPGVAKESLAVRMSRFGEQAIAIYVGGSTWSWDTLVRSTSEAFHRYAGLGLFMDAVFGAVQTVAPWPWTGKPLVGTYRWHPPYIRSW